MRRPACLGLGFSILVTVAALSACGDQGPRSAAEIIIAPNLPRVPIGGTQQLTATVVDADGRAIEGEPVAFESSDPTILTASEGGLLTSVGPRGASIVSAVSGGITAEVEAEVVIGPSAIFVSPSSLQLQPGEIVLLNVTVTDERGDSIPDPEVLLHTSNAAVAAVTDFMTVIGGEPGTATVTVVSGTHHSDVPVTVSAP
jgi:uncharacterized protein YjdB